MEYKKLQSDFFLLMIALIWGASFPIMNNVIGTVSPLLYLAARFVLAFLVLLVSFIPKLRQLRPRMLAKGGVIGLCLFSGMILQVWSMKYTTATNAAFLTGLSCVIVPLASILVFSHTPSKSMFVGAAAAGVGLFFLSGGINFSFNIGDFMALLCSFCFAAQIILIAKYTAGEDAVVLGIVQIGSAAVLFCSAWAVFDRTININLQNFVPALIFTSILGTALGFGIQPIAQKHTTPTHTAIILSCEPVFAAIFARFIADSNGNVEYLTTTKTIGCALILLGMIFSECTGQNR